MQMALPLSVPDPRVTCAFGAIWPCDPCAGCQAESARLSAQFAADVAAGRYDAEGYTPAERRAQARKAKLRTEAN